MLNIALPNGSLQRETLERLRHAGFAFDFPNRCYTSEVQSPFPVRATLMRPQHIPRLVWKGHYDAGICGWDWICESLHLYRNHHLCHRVRDCLTTLGYKKVRIVLFGSAGGKEKSIKELEERNTIFSEYPNFTRWTAEELGSDAYVVACYGTAEACVPHAFSHGVCVSETGSSLRANGLRVVQELFESETMLLVNPEYERRAESWKTFRRLLLSVRGK